VLQTDHEIQLKAWKNLAISKQMLMTAATEALGLDPECSTEELRSALTNVVHMREQADKELAEMKARVDSSDNASVEAEAQLAVATEARETADRKLAIAKQENADAISKAKAEVADKQNKLKAISVALSDTPENVVKKLKTLKKQKHDEAKLKSQIESQVTNLRKQKASLENEIEQQKAQLEETAPLVERVQELHGLCVAANETIRSVSEDEKDLIQVPELDEELLESLSKAASGK
jgi:colicin import membrane protein